MTDEELLAQIDAAFAENDPRPPQIAAMGRDAIASRLPGAALAELSAEYDAMSAGLRGEARFLTFTTDHATVELETTWCRGGFELTGQLSPPSTTTLTVRSPTRDLITTRTDRAGRFLVEEIPAGLISLVFRWPDATTLVTTWIRL